MIDFKIKAVLNPKGKRFSAGETIYICINRKVRHYIILNLEKIPKKAWSGKPLKWVNSQYPYAESHNLVIGQPAFRAPDKDGLEMIQRTGKASQKMVLQEKVSLALSNSKT